MVMHWLAILRRVLPVRSMKDVSIVHLSRLAKTVRLAIIWWLMGVVLGHALNVRLDVRIATKPECARSVFQNTPLRM